MGKEQTTVVQSGTTTAKSTPEEKELIRLEMERQQATQQGQIATQTQGLDLISKLLAGQELPGYFGSIGRGISPEVTQGLTDDALRDVATKAQFGGFLDGGVASSIGARVSGDIRRGAEEFNIGAQQNLLNLAFGGQAQVQQPLLAQANTLSGSLAGLRSINTTGQSTQESMNPFMKSFQTSLGSSLGSGSFGNTGGWFGK